MKMSSGCIANNVLIYHDYFDVMLALLINMISAVDNVSLQVC